MKTTCDGQLIKLVNTCINFNTQTSVQLHWVTKHHFLNTVLDWMEILFEIKNVQRFASFLL